MYSLQHSITALERTEFPGTVRRCLNVLRAFPTYLKKKQIENLVARYVFTIPGQGFEDRADLFGTGKRRLCCIHSIAEVLEEEHSHTTVRFLLCSLFEVRVSKTDPKDRYEFEPYPPSSQGSLKYSIRHLIDTHHRTEWFPQRILAMLVSISLQPRYRRVLRKIGEWLYQESTSANKDGYDLTIKLIADEIIKDHYLLTLGKKGKRWRPRPSTNLMNLTEISPTLAELLIPVFSAWGFYRKRLSSAWEKRLANRREKSYRNPSQTPSKIHPRTPFRKPYAKLPRKRISRSHRELPKPSPLRINIVVVAFIRYLELMDFPNHASLALLRKLVLVFRRLKWLLPGCILYRLIPTLYQTLGIKAHQMLLN